MTANRTKSRLPSILRQWDGKLTRELLLSPGGFGLGKVPDKGKPDATTTMVCGFCSTGCGLTMHLKEGHAVSLTPSAKYPVNIGMACPKGWEALAPLRAPDRARHPLVRSPNGRLERVDWPTAMTAMCTRIKAIQAKHGPGSVAFLGSGQIATEEIAFLGALAKFGMGIVHGDANTRQCMATSVVAYKETFGFDAPPYTYKDFEESDVIVLVGSNLCIAHPIMWERIMKNRHAPQIVVIDPRATETAMAATLHVPLAPKSDLAFFYGVAHVLLREGWIDRPFIDAHTSGFEAYEAHVAAFTPARVAAESGISEETIVRLARMIHEGKRVSFWWTMGVNQSHEGVRCAQSLIALALMTGNIGRPGTGANSITGQCNAMGSRLFSNTTGLPGGRDFRRADHRDAVARMLGIDVARIPDHSGLAYNEIVRAIKYGSIKALWVVGTNPAHSWIAQKSFLSSLAELELLVVQDMYDTTETAEHADIVLPAAGWGEKEGTLINSERRIGLLKKVSVAPGEALSDFSIFKLAAHYWGCGEMFAKWTSPEDVFQILKELSRGRPCDFSGVRDYEMLDEHGGIQWPLPEGASPPETERRLFGDGRFFHEDGRARFVFAEPRRVPEPADEEYPFVLLTGRGSAAQWHTETRTKKSMVLRTLSPSSIYVELNPADAARLGVAGNERVQVESRRGALIATAFVTDAVQPGHVFIPMHYEATNRLTLSVFDPHSKQPSYKACAVRVRPAG